MAEINIVDQPFDPEGELKAFRTGRPASGAVTCFLGLMRDINEGTPVKYMELEHYPGMTERSLQNITQEAERRWDVDAIRLIHRVGVMQPEDPIVLVAVASKHRTEAFRACEFLMDYLKTKAPFWKKEHTQQGVRWVDERICDTTAAERWGQP